MKQDRALEDLAALISEADHCVAFTGAGVSTLSGIQDFRGPNGLYKQPNAEAMFDIGRFRRDPKLYYSMAKDFIYGLDRKKPSTVHLSLAGMERRGLVKAVITQNIDLLHQKAGSLRVIELHGSPKLHRCLRCGWSMEYAEASAIVASGGIPCCADCGKVLKPEIVFFGECLPGKALDEAGGESRAADLMLVLGTSLTVYPAASFPEECLKSGGKIVIVNEMETPLDDRAVLRLRDLGETFEYLGAAFPPPQA
jgi:NAD-dependent deacetylase